MKKLLGTKMTQLFAKNGQLNGSWADTQTVIVGRFKKSNNMENESSILTSREVCTKYGINKYTLQNWRRGYYFRNGQKVFFFDDESHLEVEWNDEARRIEYNPIKVAVWFNKLKTKEEKERGKVK